MITKAQSLDNFIDKSLYEKNKGYYQRKMESCINMKSNQLKKNH